MAEDKHLDRLKAVVAAYGAECRRWPREERAELELLAHGHDGAAFLKEARQLDTLLDRVPGARMRDGLASEILAAARQMPRADPDRVVLMQRRPSSMSRAFAGAGQAALLAASLAGGLWLGGAGLADAWLAADVELASIGADTLDADEANLLVALDAGESSL